MSGILAVLGALGSRTIPSAIRAQLIPSRNVAVPNSIGDFCSISGDGRTILASSPLSGSPANTGGAAYVFRLVNGVWVQDAELVAPDTDTSDLFGGAVALNEDGTRALIGAHNEGQDGGASTRVGSVYQFSRESGSWAFVNKFRAAETTVFFGVDLAMTPDATRALVCANGGLVFVFARSGSTWTQTARLTLPAGASSNSPRGVALSDDGNTALVHTQDQDGANGRVVVFTFQAGGWTQQAVLSPGVPLTRRMAISANGNYALIGTTTGTTVYGFERTGTAWTQRTTIPEFANDLAMTPDAQVALIGSVPQDAFIYTRVGDSWTKARSIPRVAAENNFYGDTTCLSDDGSVAVVAAPKEDANGTTNIGVVYVLGP